MRKRIVLGTGVVSLATCILFIIRYYIQLQEQKKEQLKEAYCQSITEEDVTWG